MCRGGGERGSRTPQHVGRLELNFLQSTRYIGSLSNIPRHYLLYMLAIVSSVRNFNADRQRYTADLYVARNHARKVRQTVAVRSRVMDFGTKSHHQLLLNIRLCRRPKIPTIAGPKIS